jgi:hypothetical protein
LVSSNGTITKSWNVGSVTANLDGVVGAYCVHLSTAALANAGAATASPYYNDDTTDIQTSVFPGITTVEVDGVASDNLGSTCVNGVIVLTFFTATSSGSADVTAKAEPFYVIVA